MAAKAAVEALLRERKLDRTLTSAMPDRLGAEAMAPLDIEAVDRALAGGLPRGQISEVVGPASSGRTSLLWAALGAATRRGEYVALIDTFDRFDPPTGAACGIALTQLLWVRGQAISKTSGALDPSWLPGVRAAGGPGTLVERAIDRAIKALNLVVQSGVCTLVAIDLIDVPAVALRRLPAATWLRIERAIDGSDTAVVVLAAAPIARSVDGRSINTGAGNREPGTGDDARLLASDALPLPGDDARPSSLDSASRLPALGSRLPVPGSRVLWRGSHDRSRRFAGVRMAATVVAARWSQTALVALDTSSRNAV